jgi:preprotein translocase subunit SecG
VYITVVILTVMVALLLMVVILMQASKGGGLSATFGGSGEAMLSSRQAATVLHKVTIYLVTAFMLLCLLATLLSGRGNNEAVSVTSSALKQQTQANGFNANIPVLPPAPPGGGAPAGGSPAPAQPAPPAPAAPTGK